MRITIEIPDDQVPIEYRCDLYPSGYAEDNLHDLIMRNAILNRLEMRMMFLTTKPDTDQANAHRDSIMKEVEFLRLLQSHMKIDAGV